MFRGLQLVTLLRTAAASPSGSALPPLPDSPLHLHQHDLYTPAFVCCADPSPAKPNQISYGGNMAAISVIHPTLGMYLSLLPNTTGVEG